MKVAIYGQYYQNSTEPIIRDIFIFFNKNNVQLVIQDDFLAMLYEKKIITKEYTTFHDFNDLPNDVDILVSIGGDGTILRAATLVRNSGIPILGINAGRLGFLATVQKENIDELMQFIIDKNYTLSPRALISLESSPNIPEIASLNFAMN